MGVSPLSYLSPYPICRTVMHLEEKITFDTIIKMCPTRFTRASKHSAFEF